MMLSNMEYEDYIREQENLRVFHGWTSQEKFDLLQAIKALGSHDIDSISKDIPTKTKEQVKLAIAYYKKIAMRNPIIAEKRRRSRSKMESIPRIPLAFWAKFLTDAYPFEELQTEISSALRLIADFEYIPSPVCTDNVDCRKMYHILANAAEGKSLAENRLLSLVTDKCMLDTALFSKSFIRNTSLRYTLDHIDTTDKQMNTFTRPTSNNDLGTIQHLAVQNNYNPLHIPEEYLKPSKGY